MALTSIKPRVAVCASGPFGTSGRPLVGSASRDLRPTASATYRGDMNTGARRFLRTWLGRLVAVVLIGVAALGSASCGDDAPSSSGGPASSSAVPQGGESLDVEAFAAALERPETTIIDVRTPEEFAEGHLAGALNIDVNGPDFAERIAALDPAGTYAVYCRTGNRSAVAVDHMVDQGFESVYHLGGGIVAWTDAGHPTTTS